MLEPAPARSRGRGLLPGLLLACASCGGGGPGGGGPLEPPGSLQSDSEGRLYFVDPNRGGFGDELRLFDITWGRLVDVHDIREDGSPDPQPTLRDFVIDQNIVSGGPYTLETNPLTQQTRLIVHERHDPEVEGGGAFIQRVREAASGLPPVVPKNGDGSSPPPFSLVPRNACLSLRFDDLLDDSEDVWRTLSERVRLVTGTPPSLPFESRIVFDPHHGGRSGGRFHSTRVLIDLAVSEAEAVASSIPLTVNALGLPPSQAGNTAASAAVRLPTRVSLGHGQFHVLESLSGVALTAEDAGPVDRTSPTEDLVRAFRGGGPGDVNAGFLLDLEAPRIVGSWAVQLFDPRPAPGDETGLVHLVHLRFETPCRQAPQTGDLITAGSLFLRCAATAAFPDGEGVVEDLRVEVLGEPPSSPALLSGGGSYRPVYRPGSGVPGACWLTFSPEARIPPGTDLSPSLQATLRFSEPMDPSSVTGLERFRLVRGAPGTPAEPDNVVVASVSPSADLREFLYTPLVPLAHRRNGELYHFQLGAMRDLGHNPVAEVPQLVSIRIDPDQPEVYTGGLSLFFEDPNEIDPATSGNDLRGQFFYDFSRGSIRPRPLSYASAAADRAHPVPGIMVPFAPGVQTPLSPLGSKLQAVWRYADFGWQAMDETLYNLDVVGLNWSPIGGQAVADYYPEFEIRLAHSVRLNHECRSVSTGFPIHPNSGLVTSLFANNVLTGEGAGQEIVHPAPLGYAIQPSDRFTAATGTVMMPFPWNRNTDEPTTFTWRDTRSQLQGGVDGPGLPICIEIGAPLFLEPGPQGRKRRAGTVPTFGHPLLMEFRCFPSASGVGLNAFDISIANNASRGPLFRVFSTGGINRFGQAVQVQPDLEDAPQGGFNPNSNPPGRRTPNADNAFYIGQIDYVVRLSQVHTVWLDLRPSLLSPFQFTNYARPAVFPPLQPPGSSLVLEYRGATLLDGVDEAAFDGRSIGPYGTPFHLLTSEQGCNNCIRPVGTIHYLDGDASWREDLDTLDGARFLQVRMSFLNDIRSGASAELESLGIPVAYE